jgi:peptidoglycan/LPS O-acetylase OafA/YrhL
LRRLGVPLLFVTVTMCPVPQWLRLRADPGYDESYLSFLPRFFDVHLDLSEFPFVVQGEHFETGHLWFVVLLLAFSLMLAPVAAWLPGDAAGRLRDRLATAAQRRGAVLLPAIPAAAISALLGLEESYAGWSRWAYLLFFVCGLLLATDERFRAAVRRAAVLAAVVGVALFAAAAPAFVSADDPFTAMTPAAVAARVLYGAAGWCWLVAILGLLDRRHQRRLRRPPADPQDTSDGREPGPRRRLAGYLAAYLGTAALPLYLIHQPVVVAVAYGVVRWDAPIPVKYAVLVAASLALTVAAYDLLVRRTVLTRFLFGLRR